MLLEARRAPTWRQTIAVGDGANDLPMMGAAASIAFHPPAVREQAMISIMSGGMDRAPEVLQRLKRAAAASAARPQHQFHSCGVATAMGW